MGGVDAAEINMADEREARHPSRTPRRRQRLLTQVLIVVASVLFANGSEVIVKEITMPMLSSTMTEGTVSNWVKAVGDRIEVGMILLTAESDKAEMDVESFEEGYLAKIIVPSGETAKVGEVLGLVVESESDLAAVQSAMPRSPAPGDVPNPAPDMAVPVHVDQRYSPLTPTNLDLPPVGQPPPPTASNRLYSDFAARGVDRDINDQIPTGMSPQHLSKLLFDNAEKSPEISKQLKDLAASPGGAGFLARMRERAMRRAPPAHVLNILDADGGFTSPPSNSLLDTIHRRDSDALGHLGAAFPQPTDIDRSRHITATPSARALAAKRGINISSVTGSGTFGRVSLNDVETHLGLVPGQAPSEFTKPLQLASHAAAKAAPPPAAKAAPPPAQAPQKPASPVATKAAAAGAAGADLRPLSPMQKAIAKNMMESLKTPVFRLSRDIGTDAMQAVYSKVKDKGVTWSTLLAKAVSTILARPAHSLINASYDEHSGAVLHPSHINVAMAVASPDGGLLTPVLPDADKQDVFILSSLWSSLVKKAQSKQIKPAECSGGTFYISNLGQFGVQQFDAILPRGTGCIMSVGVAKPKIVATKVSDGFSGLRTEMTVTLTCDHRHINGIDAARFLQHLALLVEEEPSSIVSR